MLPWSFSEEGAAEKHMAQLQHHMWVTDSRTAVVSIILRFAANTITSRIKRIVLPPLIAVAP